jgi:hypothetical protein
MNNILLKENQDFLKSEYSARFWILTCSFLIIIFLVLAGFLFAAHIQVSIAEEIAEDRVSKVELNEISRQRKELEEKTKILKKQIGFLDEKMTNPSLFIDSIIESSNVGISISTIEVDLKYIDPADKKAKESIRINLRGIAKNRGDLLSLQEKLNKTGLFTSVDIPYSSFAKSADIQFTVTLNSSVDLLREKND